MKKLGQVLVPITVVLTALGAIGFRLDRAATSWTLAVSGFGLLLAWWSILSLQEQRKENFWPHTIDRLARATFVAVTLAFAAHIAAAPADTQSAPHVCPIPPPTFGEAVRALAASPTWDPNDSAPLQALVVKHFGDIVARPLPAAKRDGHQQCDRVFLTIRDLKAVFTLGPSTNANAVTTTIVQ